MKLHSFQLKLLLVLVSTVGLLTGTTLLFMTQFIRDQIERKTFADVLAANKTFSAQQALRFETLDDICSRLAGSRRLAAALEEGDVGVLAGVAQNEQEISKLSDTFLAITDKNGKTLIQGQGKFESDSSGRSAAAGKFVTEVIRNQSDRYTGFFVRDGEIFEALCKPIRTTGDLLGYVVVAFPVTNVTASDLAEALGWDPRKEAQPVAVGFMIGGQTVASSLRKGAWAKLDSMLQKRSDGAFVELELDNTPYVACANPMGGGVSQIVLFSQEPLRDLLGALRSDAMLIGAVAMVVCLAITSWLAKGIAAPIAELEAGTREVREGNLGVRVTPRTADEVGRLAEAFNEMASGLQLKEKYRGVLDKVVSPEVAEELLRGKIDLGGELRSVTVLFSDIRGFTALTEGMKPHAVLEMLNRHMTAMTEIIRRHSGIVDKFVGDAILAVFGAPKSSSNDARAALRAAVEMREAQKRMNESHPSTQLEIGFGINTGEVVAGNMGSDKQISYTVLGKTVNLAARLCKSAAPMQILASETTIAAAGEGVTAKALDPITAKGFSSSIQVFEVATA